MSERALSSWPRYTPLIGVVAAILAVLLNLRDPVLPQGGIDPSWKLAAEYAVKHGLIFGRDFVFTFGPYHYIATRLFDPATFGIVLFYDVFCTLVIFAPAIMNRSAPAAIALLFCFVVPQTQADGLVALTFLATFLICLQRDDLWSLPLVALCAPLVLSKLSFGLVLIPLLIVADIHRVARRRPPVFTATIFLATLLAYLAAGQPLSAVGEFMANTAQVISGYGRAMQLGGMDSELRATLAAAAFAIAFGALILVEAWRGRDAEGPHGTAATAGFLGFAWVLFVLFKMGFVRQGIEHSVVFHEAAPGAVALFFAFTDRPGAVGRRFRAPFAVLFVAVLATAFFWWAYWQSPAVGAPLRFGDEVARVALNVGPRLARGLDWASGQRWRATTEARAAALERLRRSAPSGVEGSVDTTPGDVSGLIASGFDYRPRPTIQSYSSYTPALQALDLAFFKGPRAPETLFLNVDDIDSRLPTLGLGATLPIIGQRYDAIGVDDLGLVLRRRAVPRAMHVAAGTALPVVLGRWTPLPDVGRRLLMARITVRPSLAGRLINLLYREPEMMITLRTRSGREATWRFIPGMAQLGVAVSPVPQFWVLSAPLLLDPDWSALAEPATAFRLSAPGAGWAFGGASVTLEDVTLAPGFAHGLPPAFGLATKLASSDPNRDVELEGSGLIADTPSVLTAPSAETIVLRGEASLEPNRSGLPPADEVRFTISQASSSGAQRTLFETSIRPHGPPVPFQVRIPAGTALRLEARSPSGRGHQRVRWGGLVVSG